LHDIRSDQAVVGEAYWDTTLNKSVIVLAVPIRRNDRGLGAFAARINLDPVATILARFSPGDSGEVSLLTGNGKLIITSRTSSPKLMETQLDEHSSQRLFSQVGNPVQYADLEGRDVVGILQRVPRLDGAVVAAMPQVEAYRQVTRLRDVTVLMVAGLLFGVGLIAYGLGLVIVRPLNRLTAGAAKVAAGDLEVDLPVISGGEVGYLTEVFNHMVLRLRESRKELERLSVTDGLTGLANRRRLMQALGSEVVRAERNAHAFSILMVDVDHFKKFNDTFGHPAGDAVLARVAAILREATRDVDLAARYGGEEFLLVLADTMTPGALEVAERIRTRLATEVFDGGAITVSVGVAQFPEDGRTAEALIMSADLALYQAKKKGRDRIVQAGPETAAGKDPDNAA
jgi:diguanylate cyclase (GGDEF)-like protein